MKQIQFNDFSLSKEILNALAALQYEVPTEVQGKVIPVALANKDIVVKSQTGSGKTASFAIPLCEHIDWAENKPQALVLTPTRELAVQVKEDMMNIGRYKRIKATAIFGKQAFKPQQLQLKQKNHVVVGTPGRVLDHLQKGTLALEKMKYLIIDEADEMLNMGFLEQVEAIINLTPKTRVTMLFSATLPEDIEALTTRYMNKPTFVEIQGSGITTNKITHGVYEVEEGEKFSLLKDVTTIENPDSCIIFCRTQERVDKVSEDLEDAGYPCDQIHGGMTQEDRFAVMNEFKRGEFRYLVATDVAARGIDIDNISLVINYDIPLEKASYVHRTGRTGRAGKEGKAITFVTPNENRFLEEIETYIDFSIPKVPLPSIEEVESHLAAFQQKITAKPTIKKDKAATLNKGIMKLYFNGGKKKKIRAVDFVGTICRIDGVSGEDIGIIEIKDNASYVEILNGKGNRVLDVMRHTTVKGKQLKVQKARD